MIHELIIGTRRSKLALAQSNFVASVLLKYHPRLKVSLKEIVTKGDTNLEASLPSIGGKGLFTKELEDELIGGGIDVAVHSLKDLPTVLESEFELGAVLARETSRDALISRGGVPLSALPAGAVIGTSSPRREMQLRTIRPDLVFKDIRGNVETRIKKVREGKYDATVLAEAGLVRLSLTNEIAQVFSESELLPAPGQGALAVQCLKDNSEVRDTLKYLNSERVRVETTAERAFLFALNAGCSAPVAALGTLSGQRLTLKGRCLASGGSCIEVSSEAELSEPISSAEELGRALASEALKRGFTPPLR